MDDLLGDDLSPPPPSPVRAARVHVPVAVALVGVLTGCPIGVTVDSGPVIDAGVSDAGIYVPDVPPTVVDVGTSIFDAGVRDADGDPDATP